MEDDEVRPVVWRPHRFSAVPWLSTDVDLRPQGTPEYTAVSGRERIHGLLVRHPFGPPLHAMLCIRAKRGNGNDGGEITVAIHDGAGSHD